MIGKEKKCQSSDLQLAESPLSAVAWESQVEKELENGNVGQAVDLAQRLLAEHEPLSSHDYSRLGAMFSRAVVDPLSEPWALLSGSESAGHHEEEILAAEEAEKYFLLSMEADGSNCQTFLPLLDLYDHLGWQARHSRLLDDLMVKFPDDKEIVIRTAAACWKRQARKKGWGYYRRALALDPLAPVLQEKFILATVSLAADKALKGHLESCRLLLHEVLEMTEPGLDDLIRGRSYLLGRWSIFFNLSGASHEARQLYDQAFSCSPNPDTLLYFYCLYGIFNGLHGRSLRPIEKDLKSIFAGASVFLAMDFLEAFRHCCLSIDDGHPQLENEGKKLGHLLARVVGSADNRQLARMLEYALDNSFVSRRLINACLRRLKFLDSRSPHYLFYTYVVEHMTKEILPEAGDIEYLQAILNLAGEAEEQELVQKLETLLTKVHRLIKRQNRLGDFVVEEAEREVLDQGDGRKWQVALPPGASQAPPGWGWKNPRFDLLPLLGKQRKSVKKVTASQESGNLLDLLVDLTEE